MLHRATASLRGGLATRAAPGAARASWVEGMTARARSTTRVAQGGAALAPRVLSRGPLAVRGAGAPRTASGPWPRPFTSGGGAGSPAPPPAGRAAAGAAASPLVAQIIKAGVTTGGLNLVSDLITQRITKEEGKPFDPLRTIRMTSFGLFFFGPYQLFWYAGLEKFFPGRSLWPFLTKLTLNQVALGPVIISSVFAWNLFFQGLSHEIPEKLRRDLPKTLVTGWTFWIPAAAINFTIVPPAQRVLYMSACGMLWAGFLSYVSERGKSQLVADVEAADENAKEA